MLTPGKYNLRFRISNGRTDLSSLRWVIDCLPHRRKLVDLSLGQVRSEFSVDFQVTGDCVAQELKLMGLAQIYPSEASTQILDLHIRKSS